MRKIKLLLASALSLIAWTGTMATVTQPTLTTDPSHPAFYTIKSLRTGKYATYTGASTQLSQEATLTKAGLWFFEENGGGVSIIPAKDPSVKLESHSSATETGAVWYLVENPYRDGYFCVTLSNNASSNCWDDQGNQTKIGYWQPSANDNQGTSWIIEPFNVENPIEVTYEIYDGETKVSSATVVQGANMFADPLPGTGINYNGFFHEKFYYDYTPESTVGDTDCTIKVTRTEKSGVVKALSELSNTKAYNIGCDRGAMIAYNGSMCSTALNDAAANAQPYGKFALLNYEGNYYIFSIDEGKFIKNDASVALDLTTVGFSTDDAMVMTPQTAPYFLWHFNADNKYLNTNGNAPLGYVINSYSTPDPGNLYYMVAVDDFDPTAALAELEAYFHPSYFVTYVVKDELGNVIFTSDPQPAKAGAKITTLLDEFKRPFYTYNDVDVTISEANTNVEFTATWTGPFEVSADFATAHWYNMAVRGNYYVTSGNKSSEGALAPIPANAVGLVEDAYQWAFVGDSYAGFKVFNKAEGDSKVYAWVSNDQASIPAFVDAEGANTWTIKPSTASGFTNAFMLTTDLGYQTNQFGGATGALKIWQSTGTGDQGSAFTVFDVPTNFAEFLVAEGIPAYFEPTGYFTLTDAAKTALGWDPAYKTDCPFEAYKNLKEKIAAFDLSDLSQFVLPETGYYTLKNKNYGTYMGIDPSDANMYGNYDDTKFNPIKNYVKLTKTGAATYTIKLADKFAPATVAKSAQVTATAEAGTYTVVVPAVGYAAFQADTENNMSVLHCAGGGSLAGWAAAAAASQWEVEDAESIQLAIGAEGYATAYLPFPVTIPAHTVVAVPEAKGTWTFEDGTTGSLEATAGVTVADGVATVPVGDNLHVTHGFTDPGNYSIMMDVKVVNENKGSYTSLFMSGSDREDGSLFIYNHKTNGRKIGINLGGMGYQGSIELDTWYRIVFSCKDYIPTVYVNGEKVAAATQAVNPTKLHWVLTDVIYFFADNDGEENEVQTSEIQLWNVALTAEEVALLGGVGHTPESETRTVKAYTGKFNNTWLDLVEVNGTIPEATPVVLKGDPTTYVFELANDVDPIEDNVLKGTFAPIAATGKYVLAQPEGGKVGFYLAESGNIAAGKAYLELDGTGPLVKAFYFSADDATGIENLNTQNTLNAPIYNLAGQRISKMQKGINIVNGKKILK